MQPLNSLTFPLHGASLIEASAGTGKTYTIVNLYLRQLLGHGCTALNVDQILVVTFTNAATAELKERIRQRLQAAYLDFYRGSSDDTFIQSVIEQSDNIALATQRLALASKQMDEAAIFTIHGFCQRALTEHAFESGAMYEQEFILDESEWLKLAVADYWRSVIVTQPADIQAMLLKLWSAPEQLLKTLQPLLNRKVISHNKVAIGTALALYQGYVEQVGQIKRWWLQNSIAQLLQQTPLKANMTAGKPATLAMMQAFCATNDLNPTFAKDGWLVFGPDSLEKALKKGGSLPDEDFGRFERLAELQQKAANAIKESFSEDAMARVAYNLSSHKSRLQLLSPDDLLSQLSHALSLEAAGITNKHLLANALRERYPTVLIDEFQDTDQIQYRIFSQIYGQANEAEKAPCWIMIGDPKQAIYGFRGADVYSYFMAKQQVKAEQQFTLDTNWRSTPKLVEAVNTLFINNQQAPAERALLSFGPVKAGKNEMGLSVNGTPLASLDFWHLASPDNKPLVKGVAQQALAQYGALQIKQLLNNNSEVAGRTLQAGDCCVLVRNRNEAQLMKNALSEQGVASVFLVRKSVFASQTALDCYRLICALSHPGDDRQVKTALLTELFALDAKELDQLFNSDSHWQQLIALFHQWHQDWHKFGLMMALNKVISYFRLEQKAVKNFVDGLRRVTDLRHVLELLQQRSLQTQGQGQLMHWFSQCLQAPDHGSATQQLRLETDANLVQISTLHASKGLQYPLVFMPFGNSYKSARDAVFHGDQGTLEVDFLASEKLMVQADKERLAEDIRLLYVALTRAEYYCAVGIWHSSADNNWRRSGFLSTALGAILLPPSTEVSEHEISNQLHALSQQADIGYQTFTVDTLVAQTGETLNLDEIRSISSQELASPVNDKLTANLSALHLSKPVTRQWRLTSYSALSQQQSHLEVITPGMDEGPDRPTADIDAMSILDTGLNAFTFEKGANAGSFLHGVLENIDFSQPDTLATAIAQQSLKFAIDEQWYLPLQDWLSDVLVTKFTIPLDCPEGASKIAPEQPTLTLAQLDSQQIKVEMEFYMSLKAVQVDAFNQLINHYMPQYNRQYDFAQLNGMLKGFIDLTLAFDGKYYVADYKSNHLGDDYADYQLAELERVMQHHDYHLQAILYTLALHRWLSQQLSDYCYSKHIGGAYYLFLRGMHSTKPGNGVYYFKVSEDFIVALDHLFKGEYAAVTHTLAIKPDIAPNIDTQVFPATSRVNEQSAEDLDDSDNLEDKGQLNLW